MVDFDDLKDKAEGLVGGHADEIKQGIGKAADFVGEKVGGEEKVQGVADTLSGFVDKLAGERGGDTGDTGDTGDSGAPAS